MREINITYYCDNNKCIIYYCHSCFDATLLFMDSLMFHLGVAQPALAALSATVQILNMFNIIRAAKMSLRAVEEV